MFADKARAYHIFRCFTLRLVPELSDKPQTKVPASQPGSNTFLLKTFLNYNRKMFYNRWHRRHRWTDLTDTSPRRCSIVCLEKLKSSKKKGFFNWRSSLALSLSLSLARTTTRPNKSWVSASLFLAWYPKKATRATRRLGEKLPNFMIK